MTEAEFWKEQFIKVTTHWYNKEQPNMGYKELIAVKERRCEDVKDSSKQLLEQHEAEMVEFTEWKDAKYVLFSERPNKYVDRIESNRNPSKIFPRLTTTYLLTLFKNRNK